nr:neuromodulin-like [Rhipicephalus microplus]
MVKKAAEPNGVLPKVGRAKRQAAPDQNAAGPSNEAAATKRPRGRPPKTSSEGPLAPTPIAPTPARKLRKAMEVTQPEAENPSASKEVAGKTPRITRAKRSRSSSSKSPNDTASEEPKRRRSKKGLRPAGCTLPALAAVPPKPSSPGSRLPASSKAEESGGLFTIDD